MKDIIELSFRGECKKAVFTNDAGQHFFCAEPTPDGAIYCTNCARPMRLPTRHFPDSQIMADRFGGGKTRAPSREAESRVSSSGVKPVDGYIKLSTGMGSNRHDFTLAPHIAQIRIAS